MAQFSSREPFTEGEWWGYPDGYVIEEIPQTNPTNTVLTDLRRDIALQSPVLSERRVLEIWIDKDILGRAEGTPEELDHARKVLRLYDAIYLKKEKTTA